ncbi:MAG: Electron transport complex subunit RsxB [Actinobacteria bacterium]|nr:Electron transport complex subunit RsxB [Actinomycetota bacterium]
MSERVGFYICHCGTNIAGTVDVSDVAEFAQTLPDVAVARDNKFMCSSEGQEVIGKDIKEKGLTRLVVAACSPLMHELTFRATANKAGMNPYLFEMCNIREHNSWITNDKEAATKKAKALVAAAVYRVRTHKPLEPIFVDINPKSLIVGGGIAGINAALEIADAGYKVYLVEREPSIGGHMAQVDKTFPTLDCSACILTPKMFSVEQHPNITLLTYSEVISVKGFIGNYDVQVRQKPRLVNISLCTGCGICQQKCPKKVIDDVHEAGLGYRKVIYSPFAQAVPKYPVIDARNCLYFKTGKCRICEKECPTEAIEFNQEEEILDLKVGNVILATGYSLFDPRRVPQYGYGRYPNVFTSLEFERMLNATGPTNGKIVLRDGETKPESVAIIHCVGSRDRNYHEYCSKVCCMYSLKFAHMIMEKTGAVVYNFYIDMRTPGKQYEEFYHRLQNEGAHFIRGRAAMVMDTPFNTSEEGKLVVQAEDTLLGMQRRIPVDMVILSPAMEPRADSKDVGKIFGLGCDAEGFFTERHPKLAPVSTMTDGVFIAGTCQGPKDIPETVAQAGAAAARVLSIISKGKFELEPIMAVIEKELCSGCRLCNDLCPYNAISFVESEKVSEVNAALCKGCGTCVAACPSQAIIGNHFTAEQIMSEIEGILFDMRQGKEKEVVTASKGGKK